ncbi:MAG: DUF5320 domain-containing protein [Clostridium sp.]|uniref:DUF5320 domain-containing protein n=1 Tax=Clostridium sp. TaxID=1506 RepID=UPI003D6D364E
MAGRNGTGPMGMGSRTGRGMGFCNVNNGLGLNGGLGVNRGLGMGIGCRGGFGGNSFNNTMSAVSQSDLLAQEKTIIENRLNTINNQLNTTQDDKEL